LDVLHAEVALELTVSVQLASVENNINNGDANIMSLEFWPGPSSLYEVLFVEFFWVMC